jgi:hypothetical protein
LTTNYPFEKFGWIVDVGGGNGSLLLPVVERHHAIRVTISISLMSLTLLAIG